jgi:nucleoid-associated protein YgaU
VRVVSDWLTLPIVRRAVDASLAGVLLARVLTSTAVVEASPSDLVAFQTAAQHRSPVGEGWTTSPLRMQEEVSSQDSQITRQRNDEVLYTVRPDDTLSGIALAFYGYARQEDRIFQANLGRLQSDGRQLNRHGLILPGWTLTVPEATRGVVEQGDGAGTW